ncbi:acetyl-CoA synthetase-like protein [Myriangium duriaei CBS 260.36]|uniref:Acetyl-CoA synthetase-like protein n=1 Tax=Myriangium duriaei CBS 260.36 TaxID=1168546 RepID=A0A9P4MHF9_9PEZI|nr:acetyl-CoA synthetase-like protein [Myriangium duriaei CBS 260.36]
MPKSRWTVDIPAVDLPTYVFGTRQTGNIGDRPILHDADSAQKYNLSLTTYRDWSKRFAAGLSSNGFQPGDRVLLYSGNTLFFPVVFMGTIMAQGVFSGANPTYVARELAYQLKDSGARFLISSAASLDVSLEAADSIGFPRSRVVVFDSGRETFDGTAKPINGIRPWTDLIGSPQDGNAYRWPELTSPADLKRLICLNYSSGTTGVPKGVMICHRNYVANSEQTTYLAQLDPGFDAWLPTAKMLCFLPMYHAYGQTYYCCTAPKRGVPSYIMPKFDFLKLLQHIQNHKITDLTLVPPIAVALAKRPEVKDYDLSSVTTAGSGAAPLGNEQARELEGLWPQGQVNVKQGWGMTEVTCSMTGWHPQEITTTHSIGEMLPNCEMRIMAEDEKTELGKNQRGEFWVRGPNTMLGYWQKPDATKDTMTSDGWLKTGDIAYLDDNDRIYIVDRKKELIKVKGNQVAPAELEALLMDIVGVADAAVIGVTIKGEEYPRAYLVLKAGAKTTVKEVQDFMNKKVAPHKRLTGGVSFVDDIPKNPSGKILRKILREQAAKELGDSAPKQSKL